MPERHGVTDGFLAWAACSGHIPLVFLQSKRHHGPCRTPSLRPGTGTFVHTLPFLETAKHVVRKWLGPFVIVVPVPDIEKLRSLPKL